MLDSSSILQLFENVLQKDIEQYKINQRDIRRAVQNLAHVYAADTGCLQLSSAKFANYNDAAHRCAYLHKYAAFHTAMVQDMMLRILKRRRNLFKTITSSEEFRICSLGGGPGNDVIGVIAALNTIFCAFKVHVTVIDLMEQWKLTFSSVIAELSNGNYGTLRTNAAENFLQWNYIGANLLKKMTNTVKEAISQASLIILVKFVSAAACQRTEKMIKRIFRVMKPGALLLFIDNAGGGFRQLIKNASNKYKCENVFGPLSYNEYCNESLKNEKFGYTSCFTTTVTVYVLQKSIKQNSKIFYDMSTSLDSENDISSAVTHISKPISEKKTNPHSNSLSSYNQNAHMPCNVKKDTILFPSSQQNANISRDAMLIAKPINVRNSNSSTNVLASHKSPSLAQSTKLPASVNKGCIPVSSTQKNFNISSAVTHSRKSVGKEEIKPQIPSIYHNIPLFQDANPVNFPVYANAPSTSQTINNFNKSVNSSRNNLPVKQTKVVPASGNPSHHHNTLVTGSNGYTSPRRPNSSSTALPTNGNGTNSAMRPQSQSNAFLKPEYNTFVTGSNVYTSPRRPNSSSTALPTNRNGTSSAMRPQSQSNAFPEPEDNSDACCTCCVIS